MKVENACVWMVGTSPEGKGGIASLIQQYKQAAFFDGGAVHFEPSHHDRNLWGRILPFLRCSIRLWRCLATGRVTLIHAHTSHGASFWRKTLLILPAIALKVPVIVHLHGSNFMQFYASGGRLRQLGIRFLFRRAFKVIALSEEWKHWILSVEPCARVQVIFNSLASHTGTGTERAMHSSPSAFFLGRIGERKGAYDLLRAYVAVKAAVPKARLVFAGDGDASTLLARAEALGIRDAVEYLGWIDTHSRSELMASCWVLALPSYQEGLPMAILEAMAFSRAVISCSVGGIAQAVEDGRTGFLVRPGDFAALGERLVTILSDRDAAARLGAAGRLAFESRFSHEATFPRLLALYREAGVARTPRLAMGRTRYPLACVDAASRGDGVGSGQQ